MSRPDLPTAGLAALLVGGGVLHLVRPEVYEPIIPAPLRGRARELVLVSGVAGTSSPAPQAGRVPRCSSVCSRPTSR